MNKKCLPYLIAVIFIGLFCFPVYSLYFSNTTGIVFGSGGNGLGTTNDELNSLIIQGAEQFLESYANLLDLMQQTESSTDLKANPGMLLPLVSKSLNGIDSAAATYTRLIAASKRIPYNPAVVDKLKNFDYPGFAELPDRFMNKPAFNEARSYLSRGDIRGLYGKMKSDFKKIARLLKSIYRSIDEEKTIPVKETWKLNHVYSQTLLLGQYTAQVCSAINREINQNEGKR